MSRYSTVSTQLEWDYSRRHEVDIAVISQKPLVVFDFNLSMYQSGKNFCVMNMNDRYLTFSYLVCPHIGYLVRPCNPTYFKLIYQIASTVISSLIMSAYFTLMPDFAFRTLASNVSWCPRFRMDRRRYGISSERVSKIVRFFSSSLYWLYIVPIWVFQV